VKKVVVVASALLCLCLTTATAFGDPPEVKHGPLGIVPAHNQAAKRGGGSNLTYHGGPVMQTNNTYAIYWDPAGFTMQPNYASTIDQFLGDVAADSGKTSNVYYSDTQYYSGTNNFISYSSAFKGSVTDTTAFPASGCTDSVAQTTVCLSDDQLRAEIDTVATANNWPRAGSLFFIFTPQNVGSCDQPGSCAFSTYCAYHWNFGSGAGQTLYANQPYTMTVPSACGSGQSPNASDADSTINVTSHEHNEAITDPLGSAWFDSRGYENGDKCAWTFGTASGPAGAQYNQTINTHHYYLQREWSNRSAGCVLTGQ
jgi:hypothetical protein